MTSAEYDRKRKHIKRRIAALQREARNGNPEHHRICVALMDRYQELWQLERKQDAIEPNT